MTDELLASWCEEHGAWPVFNAAYARMIGNRSALPELGIPDVETIGDAYRIMRFAYLLMQREAHASRLADAAIGAARTRTGSLGPH